MIAGLRGTVAAKLPDALLVDVGGVLYRVGTSTTTLSEAGDLGAPIELRTHLFVREDQLSLYGFARADELALFEVLIGVTGVGPRLACAILSRMPVDVLYSAIANEGVDLLATVPGVGKKTAARLVLELRGKLPSPPAGTPAPAAARADDDEVIAALRSLGYTVAEAHTAVLRSGGAEGATVEERVIAVLRELGAV
ncbi:MAG: RuvA [uncultured Thermomicrobiales bacterium]|uniref:Holliday junction branch migration complex subunit RuvA n=1 Tax=uncultured Thermomicrobiales bacterium TaxID=1645740 RepID=A0A6J4UAH6_9BACT|nr:MAG: RuvA [uncultured Thermomicrobiales bacterium]